VTDFRFPVGIAWPGGKRVVASVAGKDDVEIATPPEFKGEFPESWSPEDFLVAAAASCYGVTLVGMTGRAGVPLEDLEIEAEGIVGRLEEGFGFREIVLCVTAVTVTGHEDELRRKAEAAAKTCIVGEALSIPVRLELAVAAVEVAR
jgi:organic hydroperoxide reductase OsmC/OhrA